MNPSQSLRWLWIIAVAAAAAVAVRCPTQDPCSQAPQCNANQALNCEPSCQVGPCSNGPQFRDCGSGATCDIVLGDLSSSRFFRSRALCVVNGSAACDPNSAPAPTCDGSGNITGCSGYKQIIQATCVQASLFFSDISCCGFTGNPDAGTPDAGADGGTDGGTDGGV